MSAKEVLSVIRAQEDATAKGDARASVDAMHADVVVFDLPPPLAYRGEQARDIEGINAWFATWRNGVTVHMADPQLMIDGDLAVAFGLSRMTGIKTDGTKVDSWSRRTIVLRRFAGSWKSSTNMPVSLWQWTEVGAPRRISRRSSGTPNVFNRMLAFTQQGFVGERSIAARSGHSPPERQT